MLKTVDEEACRSVTAVSGNLARLAYLDSLQEQPGEYHHWGLSKEYGQHSVCDAFRRSHQLVMDTVLQTDIAELLGEVLVAATDRRESASQFLNRFLEKRFLKPLDSPSHTEIHFNWLCESLRTLARHHE